MKKRFHRFEPAPMFLPHSADTVDDVDTCRTALFFTLSPSYITCSLHPRANVDDSRLSTFLLESFPARSLVAYSKFHIMFVRYQRVLPLIVRCRCIPAVIVCFSTSLLFADTGSLAQRTPASGKPSHINIIRRDSKGQLRSFSGVTFRSVSNTPEEAARAFVDHYFATIAPEASTVTVEKMDTRRSPGGVHVRFRQTVQGVPVYRGSIVVSTNNDNAVVMAVDNSHTGISIANVTPSIAPERAIAIARSHIGASGRSVGKEDAAELMVSVADDGPHLVYRTSLTYEHPAGDWEILVDAHTGVVLHSEDRFVHLTETVTGEGFVYTSDPLSKARAGYNQTGFVDDDDADSDSLTFYRTRVPLDLITLTDSIYSLRGPYASVTDIEAPAGPASYESFTPEFNYTRSQDEFEAVNVYYHATTAYRRLLSLGFSIPALEQLRLDPHGYQGQDNSHYSPSGNWIAFGDGGVDDAEDADVIWHEYGHAIQYTIDPDWGGGECGALGEGFGDYWAASYSRSLAEWTPDDPRYNWLFNWDGHNAFWSGRVTNDQRTYPFGALPIHTAGQIWCSALLNIQDDLGRDVTDRLVLQSIYYLGTNVMASDNARAILQADEDLYAGVHRETLVYWLGTVRHFFDPSEYLPIIQHTPSADSTATDVSYTITAKVSSHNGIDPEHVCVVWGHDGVLSDTTCMVPLSATGEFEAVLPVTKNASTMCYYILATDSSGMDSRDPYDAPKSFFSVKITPTTVSGVDPSTEPYRFTLAQNFPNPFNPSTTIAFTLPEAAAVTVEVFDLLGRTVATLANGVTESGPHLVRWNSANNVGVTVSSGVYLYRIEAVGVASGSHYSQQKKMILLK